jgi:hypothetical protein
MGLMRNEQKAMKSSVRDHSMKPSRKASVQQPRIEDARSLLIAHCSFEI